MEERIIELIAKGHTIGESLEMNINLGKEFLIGVPSELTIEITGKEGSSACELSASEVIGFEPDSALLTSLGGETEASVYKMSIVPVGIPGPSILRVMVKGELYSATLAIQEIDLDILPPAMDASLVDGPVELTDCKGSLLPIKLSMPGHAKIKGSASLSLLDPHGRKIEIEGGGPKHVSFRDSTTVEFDVIPDGIPSGQYSIKLEVRGKDASFSKVLSDTVHLITDDSGELTEVTDTREGGEDRGLRLVSFRLDPSEISPGSETEIHVEIERSEMVQGPLDVTISLGKRVKMEFEILEGLEQIRERFRLPGDMRSGELTAVIAISSSEGILIREVRPRSLTIKGTSVMEMRIATPSDLSSQAGKAHEEYLFPGELTRRRRKFGRAEIWTLNSGRHLYLFDGSVIFGNDWKNDLREEALTQILCIEMAERFLEPDLHRNLKRDIEGSIHLGLFTPIDPSGKRDEKAGIDDLIKGHHIGTGGLMAEAVIRRSSGKSGQIISRSKMKELHTDPIPSIVNDIGLMLSIDDAQQDIKDHYENIIREFRSLKEGPTRSATLTAHAICMTGIRSALEEMLLENGMARGINELIFYLIASSLVRIECFTTWTDPAIGSWDDLRIERQRMLKKEISSLFDLIDDLASFSASINRRFVSYEENMKIRRGIALISKTDIGPTGWSLEGEGGEVWKGRRMIQLDPKAEGMEVITSIKLPGLSWNLVSPPSERDGSLFILPALKVPSKGRFELELEIASPGNPPVSQTGLIYLMPSDHRLEVEE